MQILLSKQAIKFLDSLNKKQLIMIKDSINGLLETPPKGNIKKLRNYTSDFRLKVANIRILYDISENYIRVNKIDYRNNLY